MTKGHQLDQAHACPKCNAKLDGVTEMGEGDGLPNPGDVSVCLYCATILRFDDALVPKEITADDMDDMDNETVILLHRMQNVVYARLAGAQGGDDDE